jgi:hypothetical protein
MGDKEGIDQHRPVHQPQTERCDNQSGHHPGWRNNIRPVKTLIEPGDAPLQGGRHWKDTKRRPSDTPVSGWLESFLQQIRAFAIDRQGLEE